MESGERATIWYLPEWSQRSHNHQRRWQTNSTDTIGSFRGW
jgi:hypothetical protein